jgi:hypothetical protein
MTVVGRTMARSYLSLSANKRKPRFRGWVDSVGIVVSVTEMHLPSCTAKQVSPVPIRSRAGSAMKAGSLVARSRTPETDRTLAAFSGSSSLPKFKGCRASALSSGTRHPVVKSFRPETIDAGPNGRGTNRSIGLSPFLKDLRRKEIHASPHALSFGNNEETYGDNH